MALKIRLRQQGRKGHRKFRLVVTESTVRRDGKYVENVGHYDPEQENDHGLVVKADRIKHWLDQGAQLSENAEGLVKRVAPAILREITERQIARRAKAQVKRRERRKALASA